MADALVLVDFENEWLDVDSEYYVGDVSAVLARVNRVIDACRESGATIVWVRHVEQDSDGAFAADSAATELISSMHKHVGDRVITKYRISPFYKTSMDEELRGIDRVVVAGILTNLCVRSFVHDAYDRDFEVVLLSDCCVAMDMQTHEFTLRDIKATRDEVEIMVADEFLSTL